MTEKEKIAINKLYRKPIIKLIDYCILQEIAINDVIKVWTNSDCFKKRS